MRGHGRGFCFVSRCSSSKVRVSSLTTWLSGSSRVQFQLGSIKSLAVPMGYRLISDGRLLEGNPEAGGLRYISGLSQMAPGEQKLLADIIEAWAEKRQRDDEQQDQG